MKVAFVQMDPRVGDTAYNQRLIEKFIAEAKALGASLVLFPELATLGYPPRDLLDSHALINENLTLLDEIAKLSQDITVVLGFVQRNSSGVGKRFFNSAAVLQAGKIEHVYHKQLLPYYDVFEEERYFEAGNASLVFEQEGKRIGITICEDAWNQEGFIAERHKTDPIEGYCHQKLDLLLNLSASPFQLGKPETRMKLFKQISEKVEAPVVFSNQVGANDELIFDGSSFAIGRGGEIEALVPPFQEGIAVFSLGSAASKKTTIPVLSSVQWLKQALETGIKDYVTKSGFKKVCLGLSGGVDSAVVAVLARNALGADNVYAAALPSRFNLSASLEDAKKLASNLGIHFLEFPIESTFLELEKTVKTGLGSISKPITQENLQPRIRMAILMALSSEKEALLLNTSNKSEIATGYATLYGDSSGALSVIGDLVKEEVYALAREINAKGEVIPLRIIERAPSAELRENQTDQDTLPEYDQLDSIVRSVVEERASLEKVDEATKVFEKLHSISEYKRHQLPPVLRISKTAFGIGRRIPIVSKLWLR